MASFVQLTFDRDIAIVTVDNPPVNALSPGVAEAMQASVLAGAQNAQVRAVVVICAGTTFIAGVDIHELARIAAGEAPPVTLAETILKIEDCPKPVVMAMHGTALGGGLEVALGGHYRVIAAAAQVGMPETRLGLIPGGSGTQRLPRLAGVKLAVEMCAFGEPIGAKEALAARIVDRIIEGDLLTGAIAFAREIAGKRFRKVRDRRERLTDVDPAIFSAAVDKAKAIRKGQPAPLAAIEAVEAAIRPFERGCQIERELFEECLRSSQAKALMYAFFGERTVSRIPDIPKDTLAQPIRSAAILGATGIGAEIAMTFADAGIPTILNEPTKHGFDKSLGIIRNAYATAVKKRQLSDRDMSDRMALISTQTTLEGLQIADVIIETATDDSVVASVTSDWGPQTLAGLQFSRPVRATRLMEVVRGPSTSVETTATLMALGRKLRKVTVLSTGGDKSTGARLYAVYLREAELLLEEGASSEAINKALVDFGMAIGPLALADLVGIEPAPAEESEPRLLRVSAKLHAMGRRGLRTGRGFFWYDENGQATADPELPHIAAEAAAEAGVTRRAVSAEEISERCVYALINEAARLLEEGVALRPVDVDIVSLHALRFPAWRGGPLFYANTLGLDKVLARMEEFEKQYGPELWAPAPLLRQPGETGNKFDL